MSDAKRPATEPLVVVSGIPGTGKSTFGEWCARNRGFVHIDAEHGGIAAAGLSVEWSVVARLPPGNVEPLVGALRRLGQPVIFDWGYPPAFLPLVRTLHAAGMRAWWFDGDRDAARRRFLERGTVSVAALDHQMASITGAWAELSAFYGRRVVEVIRPGGSFRSPSEILSQIIEGQALD